MLERRIENVIDKVGKWIYDPSMHFDDGRMISLRELGFEVGSFKDSGASESLISETLEEQDGYLDMGSSLSGRELSLTAFFVAHSYQDVQLRKRQLVRLFSTREQFYLRHKAEPGKQIRVRRTGTIETENLGGYLYQAEIKLSSASPYWESIRNAFEPLEASTDMAAGLGYDVAENYERGPTDSNFTLFNEGDAVIDPRSPHTRLKITIKGETSNLRIDNLTTGDSVRLFTNTEASSILILEDVRILKDGVSIFGLSNHGVLTLVPGSNNIAITGKSGAATVDIETKYYYV